ncbi:pre-rRNA-processing protein TSR2 homolog isoform X2 [Protopterus annectens]|uniref:pre-rRNA-processing protein TSR2 homolog isoform X2 n=1 Tax=Protopterus annectens TaxID=7888 RepID=UPI001CFAD7C5|nr:pre-rRNA-processing protein TSR2 homolog isoform X2 [Protopterus annectens]
MIAVQNGFGGVSSQEKADWMVTAVEQYFYDNDDLEPCEVEDLLSELLNNEFDTVVEDGSLPEVALQICTFFSQCRMGKEGEVRQKIAQLSRTHSSVELKIVKEAGHEESDESEEDEDEEEDEQMEVMECETSSTVQSCQSAPSVSEGTNPPPTFEENNMEDGWTVVRRKKK